MKPGDDEIEKPPVVKDTVESTDSAVEETDEGGTPPTGKKTSGKGGKGDDGKGDDNGEGGKGDDNGEGGKGDDGKGDDNGEGGKGDDNGEGGKGDDGKGDDNGEGGDGKDDKDENSGDSLVAKITDALKKGEEAAEALKKAKDEAEKVKSTAEEMKELSEIQLDSAFVEKSANLIGTLNFEDIIGKPLKAAVNAQRNMADETLKYIKEKGIITVGDESRVATVSLSFMKDGKKKMMTLPLLSLVPIPNLGISEMTYDFKISVDAASSVVTSVGVPAASSLLKANTDNKQGGAQGGGQNGGKSDASAAKQTAATTTTSADLAVSYSSKRDSSATRESKYSVETTMDVKITAKQMELPGGLQKMLDRLSESAEEIDTNGELIIKPSTMVTMQGKDAAISVSYRNGDGAFTPSEIKVTKLTDGGTPVILPSGDEVIILFDKTGTYSVSAGSLQQVVFVGNN